MLTALPAAQWYGTAPGQAELSAQQSPHQHSLASVNREPVTEKPSIFCPPSPTPDLAGGGRLKFDSFMTGALCSRDTSWAQSIHRSRRFTFLE